MGFRRLATLSTASAGLTTAALVVLAWELAASTGVFPRYIFPSPVEIARAMFTHHKLIGANALVTLAELATGLAGALVLTTAIAIPLGLSRRSRHFVLPPLLALQAVPLIAIAPLIVFWLGTGFSSKAILAGILAFVPMSIRVSQGLWSLDEHTEMFVRHIARSPYALLRYVRFPSAVPALIDSFRLAVPGATIGAVVGEFISSDKGLGYLILASTGRLELGLSFAAILILIAFAIAIHPILGLAEAVLLKWLPEHQQ